jgi:hypothetical protein
MNQHQQQPPVQPTNVNQPQQSSGIGSALAAGAGGLALGEFLSNKIKFK